MDVVGLAEPVDRRGDVGGVGLEFGESLVDHRGLGVERVEGRGRFGGGDGDGTVVGHPGARVGRAEGLDRGAFDVQGGGFGLEPGEDLFGGEAEIAFHGGHDGRIDRVRWVGG